jgi:hypothetical protein
MEEKDHAVAACFYRGRAAVLGVFNTHSRVQGRSPGLRDFGARVDGQGRVEFVLDTKKTMTADRWDQRDSETRERDGLRDWAEEAGQPSKESTGARGGKQAERGERPGGPKGWRRPNRKLFSFFFQYIFKVFQTNLNSNLNLVKTTHHKRKYAAA